MNQGRSLRKKPNKDAISGKQVDDVDLDIHRMSSFYSSQAASACPH